MDVDDLDWQARTGGGVPPTVVDLLLEAGHLDLVVRAAAERGEWFCAEAASRWLCEAGDFERAWGVVAPFAATGWQPAQEAAAEVCLRWGRLEEALDLVRPDAATRQVWEWHALARMLVRAGRVDEAIGVLAPHLADTALQSALVEMTEGQGRDERVLELLAPLAEEARRICAEGQWDVHVALAQKFRAQVLERAGRAGEAITVLGADIAAGRYLTLNTLEFYASLLTRHGRIDELRLLATGDHAADILGQYTQALEEQGRAAEAEDVLRRHLDATGHPAHRGALMALLSRQGRIDEAVEAARPAFEDPGCGNLLEVAVRLLAEDGRPERALELLDGRSDNYLEEHPQSARAMRLWLLAEAGRHPEALAQATALTPEEYGDRDLTIAWLLAQQGRTDEAIDLLRSSTSGGAPMELAQLLINQGKPAEAIALFPPVSAPRPAAAHRQVEAARLGSDLDPPFCHALGRAGQGTSRGHPPTSAGVPALDGLLKAEAVAEGCQRRAGRRVDVRREASVGRQRRFEQRRRGTGRGTDLGDVPDRRAAGGLDPGPSQSQASWLAGYG